MKDVIRVETKALRQALGTRPERQLLLDPPALFLVEIRELLFECRVAIHDMNRITPGRRGNPLLDEKAPRFSRDLRQNSISRIDRPAAGIVQDAGSARARRSVPAGALMESETGALGPRACPQFIRR